MRRVSLIFLLCIFAVPGLAAQRARVITENATIFEQPNASTDIAAHLHEGSAIYVSSTYKETSDGSRWYKVFLDSGKFGFVKSTELFTEQTQRAQQSLGLAAQTEWDKDDGGVWTFALRAMGLGGAPLGTSGSFVGAEVDLSFCIPLWTRTVWRQSVALGVHAQYMGAFELVGPTVVFRIPTLGRAVPELRLRGSAAIPTATYFLGGTLGVQYPFTLDPSFHLSGSMELGGAAAVSGGPLHAWAAAGVGLHF